MEGGRPELPPVRRPIPAESFVVFSLGARLCRRILRRGIGALGSGAAHSPVPTAKATSEAILLGGIFRIHGQDRDVSTALASGAGSDSSLA